MAGLRLLLFCVLFVCYFFSRWSFSVHHPFVADDMLVALFSVYSYQNNSQFIQSRSSVSLANSLSTGVSYPRTTKPRKRKGHKSSKSKKQSRYFLKEKELDANTDVVGGNSEDGNSVFVSDQTVGSTITPFESPSVNRGLSVSQSRLAEKDVQDEQSALKESVKTDQDEQDDARLKQQSWDEEDSESGSSTDQSIDSHNDVSLNHSDSEQDENQLSQQYWDEKNSENGSSTDETVDSHNDVSLNNSNPEQDNNKLSQQYWDEKASEYDSSTDQSMDSQNDVSINTPAHEQDRNDLSQQSVHTEKNTPIAKSSHTRRVWGRFSSRKQYLKPASGSKRKATTTSKKVGFVYPAGSIMSPNDLAESKIRWRRELKARKQAIAIRNKQFRFPSVIQSKENQARCKNCRLFIGRKEEPYRMRFPFPIPATNSFSFTIVSATTLNRIHFLPFLLKRWKGHFSIAMKVTVKEVDEAVDSIKLLKLPSRVRIILYIASFKDADYNDFPVNKLRNIAITNIVTSHFLVLDMDMWPAKNLYAELCLLPKHILNSTTSATIVPAFFIDKRRILSHCNSLLSCAKKSEMYFPTTRKELYYCIRSNRCLTSKVGTITHRYISYEWFTISEKKHYVQMKCFPNRFQEPYLLLKYDENTLFFDERFVNYGCNKVQYVDYIRHLGYKFYIITNSFAMDIVHHDSSYRKDYIGRIHKGGGPMMKILCTNYQEQLTDLFKGWNNQTRICKAHQTRLYVYD